MGVTAPFRFGLIGCRWGLNYLRTMVRHPEWEVAVVARASGQPLPEPFAQVPVVSSWPSLARMSPPLHGVIIAGPPHLHTGMARLFIDQNLPVIIEKPLTLNPNEARTLQRLANTQKVTTWVDHTHLFHPAFRKLKDVLAGSNIKQISSGAGNMGPFRTDTTPYWDWLPHDVAMILDLVEGSPTHIAARRMEGKQLEQGWGETIELRLEFPSGVETITHISNMSPAKSRWMTVASDRGCFRYDGLSSSPLTCIPGEGATDPHHPGNDKAIAVSHTPPLDNLLQEFTAAVHAQDYTNASLELGCRVTETLRRGEHALNMAH